MPSPDPLTFLASLPKCAADCSLAASSAAARQVPPIPLDLDVCKPPHPFVEQFVGDCVRANCTVRDALTFQNTTMITCGAIPSANHVHIPIFVVFLALTVLAVLMRYLHKFTSGGRFWWDDAFLFLALAGCIGYSGVAFENTVHGYGKDMWSLHHDEITYLFVGFYAGWIVYAASRLFLRHAIILFYLRIFTVGNPRPVIIGTLIVNTLLSVGVAASVAFQCQPIALFWLRWDGEHEGTCFEQTPVFWSGAIASMVMDIWVILLPLPYIARLQLSLKKRLGISVMLAVGICVIAISVVKFLTIKEFESTTNPTLEFPRIGIWSALELDLGVICACLPGMRLFLRDIFTRMGWISPAHSLSDRYSHSNQPGNNAGTSRRQGTTASSFHCSRGSQSKIRITTTIQQKASPTESETYLPLDALTASSQNNLNNLELGTTQHGTVKVHAWA